MKNPIFRQARSIVAGGILLLSMGVGPSIYAAPGTLSNTTAATPSDDAGVPVSASFAPDASVLSYWTADVMAAAVSAMPTVDGAPAATTAQAAATSGSPTTVASKPPKGQTAARVKRGAAAADAQAPSGDFGVADAYNYPPPASNVGAVTDLTVDITAFPWSPNGVLFFHDPRTGGNFRCSGAAINSNNLSVVFAAGHCVANGGRRYFFDRFLFCPEYDATIVGDPCQGGRFTARNAWTLLGWFNNGTLALDDGAIVANCDDGSASDKFGNCAGAFGNPIVAAVGGEGIAFNFSRFQHFWNIGYPAGAPYNGCCMDLSTASWNRNDLAQGSPPTIGIGSNFTGGSSGGQWYIGFGGADFANGHNDYIYTNQPLQMYSPYYGNEALNVYNAAAND